MVAALLGSYVPATAQQACNPPGAPLGSVGCQPPFASVSGADLVLVWRPSLFPNSLGQVNVQQLADAIRAAPTNLPTSCAGLQSGVFWNNAGVVSVCP